MHTVCTQTSGTSSFRKLTHSKPKRRQVKRKISQLNWRYGNKEWKKNKRKVMLRMARQGGIKDLWTQWFTDIKCQVCSRGDKEERMLLCDHCDSGYHMHCLRPIIVSYPRGLWFCQFCSQKKSCVKKFEFEEHTKAFQTNHQSILKYFKFLPPNTIVDNKSKNVSLQQEHGSSKILLTSKMHSKQSQKKRGKKFTRLNCNRQKFRLPKPTQDLMRRLMQLATFASAMEINNMKYVM